MKILNISIPTREQVTHGVERVVGVAVVGFAGQLLVTNLSLSTVSVRAAVLAAITAVYQAFASTLTNK